MAYWGSHDNVVFKRCSPEYMVKAGIAIQTLCSKGIHAVTCLAHALHRLAKKLRGEYPDVDKVVSSVK